MYIISYYIFKRNCFFEKMFDILDEIYVEKPITGKVFGIDDGEQCTMLWADEY